MLRLITYRYRLLAQLITSLGNGVASFVSHKAVEVQGVPGGACELSPASLVLRAKSLVFSPDSLQLGEDLLLNDIWLRIPGELAQSLLKLLHSVKLGSILGHAAVG